MRQPEQVGPPPRGSGCADSFDLDEYAFTRASASGVDHALLQSPVNLSEATRSTRVVERLRILHDVSDAVFQLPKDIGAMIDAQSVTCTQILINPHPHQAVTLQRRG